MGPAAVLGADRHRHRLTMAWIFIAITVVGTVYGQLILKWQVNRAGALPSGTSDRIEFLARLLVTPWVISVWISAAIAAFAWTAALAHFELSRAYPFVGLTFVTTLLASAILFGEHVTFLKVLGTVIVLVGVVVASQG